VTDFTKKELLKFYGLTYLIVALLETILFTSIHGDWSFRTLILNFSIWGLIWLVSMFAYPMFITDANPEMLKLSPYLSLLGYVLIFGGYYLAFRLHKRSVEKRIGKKLTFSRLLDLYFPVKTETVK